MITAKRYGVGFCLAALALLSVAGCGGGTSESKVGFEAFLGINPQSAVLSTGQKQEFHASLVEGAPENLSWKVQEGDAGGTLEIVKRQDFPLDEVVIYTAPQTTGTYHVQVTGKYNDGKTKTAAATVEVK